MDIWRAEGEYILAAIKRQKIPLARSTTLVRNDVLEDGVHARGFHSRPEGLHVVCWCLIWGSGGEGKGAFELSGCQ